MSTKPHYLARVNAAIAADVAYDIAIASACSNTLPWPTDAKDTVPPTLATNRILSLSPVTDTQAHADRFLKHAVERLMETTFLEFLAWPEYPEISSVDLRIPANLSEYTFTLIKDTLPDGNIRIALQRHWRPLLGTHNMAVDGFAMAPDGTFRALLQQEVWYLS